MRSDGVNILVSSRGNNQTVIKAIGEVYREHRHTCSELVDSMRGYSAAQCCEAVFDYVVDYVRYCEDPGNNQYVKTPARLLADGVGDCKSMAVFIASCLYCLGIDHCFRFVSFNMKPIYTHVYVVAKDERGKEIIIDPVERVNGLPKFNYAQDYILKRDITC